MARMTGASGRERSIRPAASSSMMNLMESPMHIARNNGTPALRPAPDEVLVFKTSVKSPAQVDALRPLLDLAVTGIGRWNFDLEDRDRILRVESESLVRERIMALLTGLGYACEELD